MDPIVFQGGAAVALIAVFVFLIMGRKSWKFFHSFCMFLVFVSTWVLLAYSALVVKTHLAWKEVGKTLEDQVDKLTVDEQQKIHGDLLDPKSPREKADNELSLVAAKAELRRILYSRGRVWRDCQAPLGGPPYQVTTVPAGADPATSPPNNIKVNEKLVAFAEGPNANGIKVPTAYIGEFQVTAATASTVTLQPILPIVDPGGGFTWVLYEKMPADFHGVYAGLTRAEIEAALPMPPAMTPEDYSALIDQYEFDGKKTTELEGKPGFDPVPESQRKTLVKFKALPAGANQPDPDDDSIVYVMEVNGDTSPGVAFNNDAFDAQGLSLHASLHQFDPKTGAPVKSRFREGDELFVDNWDVVGERPAWLVALREVADEQYSIFSRDLIDFEFNFREFAQQKDLTLARTANLIKQNTEIADARTIVDAQIAELNIEIGKLQQDQTYVANDREKVIAYRQKLESDWSKLQAEIVKLWKANNDYEAYLASLHARLNEEIQKRVDKVKAEASGAE